MLKDTPQGQTNHCPMCEDAAKRIEELERRIAMLVDALRDCASKLESQWHRDTNKTLPASYRESYRNAFCVINATSAQSSAWLNKKIDDAYAIGAAEQKEKYAKICDSLAERDYCVDVRVAAKAIRSQE